MADNAAHADSGQQPTRPVEQVGAVRHFPFSLTLAVSALLSVVFVVVVAALIAFMQYQTRLLRSQPGVTANQLVYYVQTEEAIDRELVQMAKKSEELSKKSPNFTSTSNEIKFRIGRICSLFGPAPDAQDLSEKCHRFLKQIPFDGTATTSGEEQVSTLGSAAHGADTAAKSSPGESISTDLLKSIQTNFINFMGVEKVGGIEFPKIVFLFQSDIAKIAELNQIYELHILPDYLRVVQEYSAKCRHLKKLIDIVSVYHTRDANCDPSLYDSIQMVDALQPAQPVPGGEIVQAQGGSILPRAQAGDINGAQDPQDGTPAQPGPPGDTAAPNDAAKPLPPAELIPQGGEVQGEPSQQQSALSLADRQRTFELVTHYQFYDRISFGKLQDILISPNDFLALALVCVAGILGALLRIVFASYVSGKDPSLRSVVISPILGLICALVVYNLFRAGFIVITDQSQSNQTAVLNSFVIALLAMAAGLLSERTIEFFRSTSDSWLGSADASQKARWAVNLQRELDAQSTTVEKLAERLDVSATKLKDWAQEKEPVPIEKQREISIALNVPDRHIFTDVAPPQTA